MVRMVFGCGLWGIAARIHLGSNGCAFELSCGLWGIAARIHCLVSQAQRRFAVACGESPLGYTVLNACRLR